MKWQPKQIASVAAILALAGLVVVSLVKTRGSRGEPLLLHAEPAGIMGTESRLTVVTSPGHRAQAERALREAEASLRRVEALTSTYLESSEISRLNHAGAGRAVPLSEETREILIAARDPSQATRGAFDVTCRPLIELWREAAKSGRPPGETEIRRAREESRWEAITIGRDTAVKAGPGVRVDLGGIAKGWAIDRAVEAMRAAGAGAGLVDVGGDLRCFGAPPDGDAWAVGVRNPFGEGLVATLRVRDVAVATSGDYARYVTIGGRRYSHIVNPATGYPVSRVPSVTVIATAAVDADIWATGLSVLGPDGLSLLPAGRGIEALVIFGDAGEWKARASSGFGRYIESTDEPRLEELTR